MLSRVVIFSFLGALVLGLMGWRVFYRSEGKSGLIKLEKAWELKEKEKTIRALEEEVAKLQARLGRTEEVIQAAEPEPRNPQKEETPGAGGLPLPGEVGWSGPRIYRTIRTTPVFENPSFSSRKVAMIPEETRVRVVGSAGEWLEIRSRHGRPPGFIYREDAVLVSSGR